MLAAMVGMTSLFIYCYFGKTTTENFLKISNCLYESDWLSLPNGLQKYFILMIGNANRPNHFYGFEIVILNLETFAIVSWHTAFQYLRLFLSSSSSSSYYIFKLSFLPFISSNFRCWDPFYRITCFSKPWRNNSRLIQNRSLKYSHYISFIFTMEKNNKMQSTH